MLAWGVGVELCGQEERQAPQFRGRLYMIMKATEQSYSRLPSLMAVLALLQTSARYPMSP